MKNRKVIRVLFFKDKKSRNSLNILFTHEANN